MWRWLSGSVRKRPKKASQKAPRVAQVFWPERRQPPSTRRAVLRPAARSLPALGSDQPWHQSWSAEAIFFSKLSFCASVPHSKRVGASRKMPFWVTRDGAPAR